MKIFTYIILSIIILFMSGCATVYSCFAGYSPKVQFVSGVNGIDGIEIWGDVKGRSICYGKTPCIIKCARCPGHHFILKHPSCADTRMTMNAKINYITLGNLIIWPFYIVDIATNGVYYFPSTVFVTPDVIPYRPPNKYTTQTQLQIMAIKECELEAYDPAIKAEALTKISAKFAEKKEVLDAMYIKLRCEKKYE